MGDVEGGLAVAGDGRGWWSVVFYSPSHPEHTSAARPPMTTIERNPLICAYCLRVFKRDRDKQSHQKQNKACRDGLLLHGLNDAPRDVRTWLDVEDLSDDPPEFMGWDNDPMDEIFEGVLDPSVASAHRVLPDVPSTAQAPPRAPTPPPPKSPPDSSTVDFYNDAGSILRKDAGVFERWQLKHGHKGNPYHPFKNKLDWEVARWAKQEGPGTTALDRLLSIESVCKCLPVICNMR